MIQPNFSIWIPHKNECPNFTIGLTLAFWGEQLHVGLLFPIPRYLCQISKLIGVPLNQFTNVLRMMIVFFILVKGKGGEPDVDLFFTHFACKYIGVFFFYVCGREWRGCAHLWENPTRESQGGKMIISS